MKNVVKITNGQDYRLDRLSSIIPLVEWQKLNIKQPRLVRVAVYSSVAKEMLALNVKNRRIRRNAVDYLKHQITVGEWRNDHPQPVIFSDGGRLIDGQHRLQAILEMNIDASSALIVRVETGAHDDVREYLDTGVPRSLDDRVELVENHTYNKVISQLCMWDVSRKGYAKRPSPEDAKEWFSEHHESALFVAQHHRRDKGVGKIQVAFAAMEYYERNPAKALEFYPALFVVDSAVQQARLLRDYCLRTMGTSAVYANNFSHRVDMYLRAVACMKAHRDDRVVSIVRKAEW